MNKRKEISSTLISCGAVYYAVRGSANFQVGRVNQSFKHCSVCLVKSLLSAAIQTKANDQFYAIFVLFLRKFKLTYSLFSFYLGFFCALSACKRIKPNYANLP